MRDSRDRSLILKGVILTLALTGVYFATAPKSSWTHDPFTYTVAAWSLGSRGSLVLDGDPLADIANPTKVKAVVANGRVWTVEQLVNRGTATSTAAPRR